MTTKSVLKLPTFDRVLVKPLPSDASSLIHVEDRSAYVRGEIIAVGPLAGIHEGVSYHTFKKGQIVTYDRTKALQVTPDQYLINDKTIVLVE
jgi:hypothetical protein